MANNFLQWNPGAVNQDSDIAYSSDSQRSGGASSGTIFTSLLGNKLFYQLSIMVAALAGMLANKGYTPNDGSASPGTALATLETVLANIITGADLVSSISISNTPGGANGGVFKFGAALSGLIIQWGTVNGLTTGSHTITFPITFVDSTPSVFITPIASSGTQVTGNALANFTVSVPSGTVNLFWFAIGN